MKKKLLALLLCVLLILSLAACGEKEEDVRGSVESGEKTDVSGAVTPEEEETPEEPEAEVSAGSLEGGVYTSTFLGIACELDSNWTYATEEELAEMNNLSSELVNDEELAELMENSPTIFDMYAYADDGMTTMNIVLENLGVIYGITLDEDGYLDMGMETLEKALESMELEDMTIEKDTVEFAGAEHVCVRVSATYMEVPFYQEQIYVKQGSYMGIVTMSCFMENILPDLEQMFYAV